MSDPGPGLTVPDVPVSGAPRSLWQRASVVWLVPLVALMIALAVAYQSYSSSGPLIEIVFDDAAGVVARETELRYRNVAVGVVEDVQFTAGLEQVLVSVRLDPEVAPYVDADSSFWVVRPRISTQQITGIETVLSGVFIEGVWDAAPGTPAGRFEGRDDLPLLGIGQEGLEFTLFASDGTLTSAMPLLYNGVVAGQVGEPRLGPDGRTVEAEAVVYAPFDALVTEATKFWDASGFRLSVGSGGADVDFDSLSSLLMGGLAFDTFVSGAVQARDGARFRAYYSEDLARDSLVIDPDTPTLELSAVFTGTIAGLVEGAPVELEGLRVGDVTSVQTLIDTERFGDDEIHLQASFAVQPTRLGLEGEDGRDAIFAWLQARVDEGLRARLVTASILGGLKIQLVTLPGLAPASIDLGALPAPALPVAAAEVTDIAGTAQGLVDRIDQLPVEELLASATTFLDNAGILVGSADAQAVPGEVRALLADLRAVTASAEVQALPADVRAVLVEAEAILAQANEAGLPARLAAALDAAAEAAVTIEATTAGVPELVTRLTAVAARAETVDVQPLLDEVAGLSAQARALLEQPGLQGLPAQISTLSTEATAALTEARRVLAGVDSAELSQRLSAAIASAEEAARGVQASVAGVPALVTRIDALAATANDLPVEELVAELTGLAASANTLVSAPGTQALPADLSAALAEVQAILADARAADVVGSLNATLLSAQGAAESLPALVGRASALLDQAGGTLSGFDDTSALVRDAQDAIRDVAAAADAIAALARAIERDPNSLIFGD